MTASESDTLFMKRALELAQKAFELGEVPVGAVVVLGGQIIGEGWNQPISAADPSAHAEVIALRDAASNMANYRLPGAELFVTIEPCTMCAGAMMHARVSRLVFGATEPKAGVVCSRSQLLDEPYWNNKVTYIGGVLAEEATEIIQRFFRMRREQKVRKD